MADAVNEAMVKRKKATRWAIGAALAVLALTLGALNPAIAIVGAVAAFWTVRTGMMMEEAKTSGFAAAPVADRFPSDMASAALGSDAPVLEAPAAQAAIAAEPTAAADAPVKPPLTAGAPERAADDLKKIKGVGPKLEKTLNAMGVHHFDQIAAWSPQEVAWMDEHLEGFKGRVTRDDWVEQAKILAAGGETEFSARADRTDAEASQG